MRPVSKTEIQKTKKYIRDKMSRDDIDELLAKLVLYMDRVIPVIETISQDENLSLTAKQKREIEKVFSVGPAWLNYTVKTKDKK